MKAYKVLIVDDDVSIHSITKLILHSFDFEGDKVHLFHAYSGAEAKTFLLNNPDTAVVFLDVVMETSHSGLDVVQYLRKELLNYKTRIILRTGQPGEAPEETIIRDYDINDYRLKTDMTAKRLYTSLYATLRSYRDIVKIDDNRIGLEKIIASSGMLFRHNSLEDFLHAILNQLSQFIITRDTDLESAASDGVVILSQDDVYTVIAGIGKYNTYIGCTLKSIPYHDAIMAGILECSRLDQSFVHIDKGFIIRNQTMSKLNYYIFIANQDSSFNFDLIKLFLSNYTVALDNYILSGLIHTTQREIIITLGEVVEKHFDETSGHVKRISDNMYAFAVQLGLTPSAAEVLSVASTMHDIGKIAMPDSILKKPGKLTTEEFDIIKQHPVIGHSILSKSHLDVLKASAEIAYSHHERFDGTGYPCGISGNNIPLGARMLSILDVFDAMSHKRVYKEASERSEVLHYLIDQRGKHFDPELLDTFIDKIDLIVKG